MVVALLLWGRLEKPSLLLHAAIPLRGPVAWSRDRACEVFEFSGKADGPAARTGGAAVAKYCPISEVARSVTTIATAAIERRTGLDRKLISPDFAVISRDKAADGFDC